ncbi:MAG TPA: hypothetical protein PLA94_07510 [Myxococcota bacterium]|nr:hypothetical protein [Myxococcota bacterium]
MSNSTTIFIGGAPPGGTVGAVGPIHIHIGCETTFAAQPTEPPKTITPPPPPQLDPGTNGIRDYNGKEIGVIHVYSVPQAPTQTIEYWVAFSDDDLETILAGTFRVAWTGPNNSTWEDTTQGAGYRSALKTAHPQGSFAEMQVEYVSPPPTTLNPSPGTTDTKRFLVLNGPAQLPELRGGLFREVLQDKKNYRDHWRLHSGYVAPTVTAGVPQILMLVPAYPVNSLTDFLTTHANGGGQYVKVDVTWEAL